MLVLGIDPGATTGAALVRVSTSPVLLWTWRGSAFDFVEQVPYLLEKAREETRDGEDVLVSLEWPQGVKTLFKRWKRKQLSRPARDTLCFNIGKNHRDAQWIEHAFVVTGTRVFRYTPQGAKWDQERVEAIFGKQEIDKLAEHVRDGIRAALAHPGRNFFDEAT